MNTVVRVFGLFVCIWFVANQFLQDIWWPLVVLDKFAAYFLAASIPILLASLFTKKAQTVFVALLPVLVAGYFYFPLLMPASTTASIEKTRLLRIATYNIWNHNVQLRKVVALINSTHADVIAVQELTDVQQLEFVELMSKTYPFYYVSKPVYGGTTALFSRLELHHIQELDFNIDRPAILADVEFETNVITVVAAHLNPSFWAYHNQPLLEIPRNYHHYIKDQNTQARMLIDAAQERPDSTAVVLACDCNSQETASTNRLLETYFRDAYATIGFQVGEPVDAILGYERKLSHIDYIWYVGALQPAAVYRARASAGSDHAPVLADFYIQSTLGFIR